MRIVRHSGKDERRKGDDKRHAKPGVHKDGLCGAAVDADMLRTKKSQQQPGDGDADTHRQLHNHRQQTIAAARQIVREIFQRQGVHGGETRRVDHPL